MSDAYQWMHILRDMSLLVALSCLAYSQVVLSRRISNLWDALHLTRRLMHFDADHKDKT